MNPAATEAVGWRADMTGPIAHGVVMQLTGHIIGVLSDPTLAATLQPWRRLKSEQLG